ncbi:DNA repair protein [Aspergillus terreus]|uniref:DNA repair protein n=1 Tax=Aspergillus terreus TaxID=33178 RepID=A0A5M3YYP8_ASPTE|nr:hypothetical protein ATETN484_0006026900 [Aspergillus terreus]GFF20009.1 DNA repair protein [Aspergillus terreus]
MHKLVVPKLSGAHRFACLALYRALLRQSAYLPTTTPELGTCKWLIQHRFRKYKGIQSPSQVANALRAGYEALDLFHSASLGNQHDINRITTLVSENERIREQRAIRQRALSKANPPKPLSPRQKQKEESRRFQEQTACRHPDATSIFSRPHLIVNGRRKVPVLVNARGVPFLRIKKPQPKNLSGVIRTKLEKRWKRIERRDRLQLQLLFCKDEDFWDSLTTESGAEQERWVDEVKKGLSEVNRQIQESDKKNKEVAEAMWNIVLAERDLAAKEQQEASTDT